MNSLFASWSPKKFSEVIFKEPRQTELLFWVHVSQLNLLFEELHVILSASGRGLCRLHPRHWSIDECEHIEALCALYTEYIPSICQSFFIWQGRVLWLAS